MLNEDELAIETDDHIFIASILGDKKNRKVLNPKICSISIIFWITEYIQNEKQV